jgi:hypothetical protein
MVKKTHSPQTSAHSMAVMARILFFKANLGKFMVRLPE